MTSFWRTGAVAAALCSAAVLPAACSNDDGADPKQCSVVPAYELTLTAVSGPLPPDTRLTVQYGGGTETYRVDTGDQDQKVVLCKTDVPDGGDAGPVVTEVRCELWTQGSTLVTVEATGFDTVEKSLKPDKDGDCFNTLPVEITLGDQDAAP
jgi:hypothetical protein